MGIEPTFENTPLDISDFPPDIQVAFFAYDLLTDRYSGMDNTWVGKDWTGLMEVFELLDIEPPYEHLLVAMRVYEQTKLKLYFDKKEREHKAQEAKASRESGKKFVHKVQG